MPKPPEMITEQFRGPSRPSRGRLPQIAILASGSGTTAEYVVHATQTGVLQARVAAVISNVSTAGVFSRVDRLNEQYGLAIAKHHISGKTHPEGRTEEGAQTDQEAAAIADICEGFDLIAMVGYMKKARGPLLDLRVVNTHPGPLPQTAGCHGVAVQKRVFELDMDYSAQTLHYANEAYDEGEIIAVHTVPRASSDTPDTLFDAVQVTEKAWLPRDLNTLLHY